MNKRKRVRRSGGVSGCGSGAEAEVLRMDLDDDDLPPEQRHSANARERTRMRVLSKAFVKLKTTLPWVPPDTKLSKLDTLRLATCYIAHLRQILDTDSPDDRSRGGLGGGASGLNDTSPTHPINLVSHNDTSPTHPINLESHIDTSPTHPINLVTPSHKSGKSQ